MDRALRTEGSLPGNFERPEIRPDRRAIVEAAYDIYHADAFDWLAQAALNSIHAVVTHPPYGLVEFSPEELEKRRNGRGGVWRIPPAFDGCKRSPLPRFTVLTDKDKRALESFFRRFAEQLLPVIVPGGHVLIATNPLVSHYVYTPFMNAGFEKRGEIIRAVQTLRVRPETL